MLATVRKFSSSIFAKIFLVIIAIPFVFWGMGDLFSGGNLNTIVKIGKEKIPTQTFINYIKKYASQDQELNEKLVEKLFSTFVGEKLISMEIENLNIGLTNKSLSKLIRNDENFQKDNKFSRTEYEKFLIKNSLSAVYFEEDVSKQIKRELLFNFIGDGIVPPKFLINTEYDKMNQKRDLEMINLNDFFEKNINFSENEIISSFNQNKNLYMEIYKSIKFVKLNPKNLTGNEEFTDSFFQKIDQIDDLIIEGLNLDFILKTFNFEPAKLATLNKSAKNLNPTSDIKFPSGVVKKIFNINESDPIVLIEEADEYLLVELIKTESIQKKIDDEFVKDEILLNLKTQAKRKFIVEIIDRINKNNFTKTDFDKFSKSKKMPIKKIKLENLNDDKILKRELTTQVYAYPEKKVIIVTDISLSENFLVYIDKIYNVSIEETSENYKKYFSLSKTKITNDLFIAYEAYLKNKYEIDINYKALDRVKNYIE